MGRGDLNDMDLFGVWAGGNLKWHWPDMPLFVDKSAGGRPQKLYAKPHSDRRGHHHARCHDARSI
jgi:hypothetical protein